VIELFNAVSLVVVLALISSGLAVVFGVMGIINLAHGEFFMLGAYTVVAVGNLGGSFWLGLVAAPVAIAAGSVLLEVSVIRWLYARPVGSLLATAGVSLVLRQLVEIVAGQRYRNVNDPLPGMWSILGISYPAYRLAVIAVSIVALAAMYTWFSRSGAGVRIRAAMENSDMAAALGVNTRRVYQLTFAISAALAALAGALMSPLVTVEPQMGVAIAIDAFLIVIVGGLRSLAGVAAGAVVLGTVASVVSDLTDPVIAQIAVLVAAIIVIRFRPRGIVAA